jgi:hypothetical protein
MQAIRLFWIFLVLLLWNLILAMWLVSIFHLIAAIVALLLHVAHFGVIQKVQQKYGKKKGLALNPQAKDEELNLNATVALLWIASWIVIVIGTVASCFTLAQL